MRSELLLITFFFLMISCKEECKDLIGNEINEMLIINADKNQINYCSLYTKAKEGNIEAIRKISLLNFEDSSGYEHGIILIDLIEYTGEKKYISALSTITIEEKRRLFAYLDVGLQYTDNTKFKEKEVKNVFPTLSVFLSKI